MLQTPSKRMMGRRSAAVKKVDCWDADFCTQARRKVSDSIQPIHDFAFDIMSPDVPSGFLPLQPSACALSGTVGASHPGYPVWCCNA